MRSVPSLFGRLGVFLLPLVCLSLPGHVVHAQTTLPGVKSGAAVGASAPKLAAGNAAGWNALTVEQKQALKPLAGSWDKISESQQRKWLALSQNYATMAPAEQATLHSRMSGWVALSPQQRSQARLNFGETRQLAPDDRKAKWEAYQALSPEERRRLGASAPGRPSGAAPAVKPVSPQKLVPVPAARAPNKPALTPASAASQVQKNTLLPKTPASAASAPTGS